MIHELSWKTLSYVYFELTVTLGRCFDTCKALRRGLKYLGGIAFVDPFLFSFRPVTLFCRYLPQASERHLVATFDAAHSLGSLTVPIFVQSSQAINRNPSHSNCRMLKLDYTSMRICNFPMEIPATTIQKYT